MRFIKNIFIPCFILANIFLLFVNKECNISIIDLKNCYQRSQSELLIDTTENPNKPVIQKNRRSKIKIESVQLFKSEIYNYTSSIFKNIITKKEISFFELIFFNTPSQEINLHLLSLF